MYKQIQNVGHEYIIVPSGIYMITWWIYSDGTVGQCKQFFSNADARGADMKNPNFLGFVTLTPGRSRVSLNVRRKDRCGRILYSKPLSVNSPDYPRKNCCVLFLSLAVENSKTTVIGPLSGLELTAATVTTYDRIPHWGRLVPGDLFVTFKGFSLNTNQRGGKWLDMGETLKTRVNLC